MVASAVTGINNGAGFQFNHKYGAGFVNATADFTDHPSVVNGASDFLVQALGDAGKHARAAVGCASLPRGVAVEVEAVFEVG